MQPESPGEPLWGGNHFAAYRALEIAVAGGHHILLAGPPGVGKKGLLAEVERILPPLTEEERGELEPIYGGEKIEQRPVRWLPPQARVAGTLGNAYGSPGEASLAHRGALILDNLAAFTEETLAALPRVLDERVVALGNAHRGITLPAAFTLFAAIEVPDKVELELRLRPLMSLPPSLYERFAIRMEVDRDPPRPGDGEPLSAVLERIARARAIQAERFRGPRLNGEMSEDEVAIFCVPDRAGKKLLALAETKVKLDVRKRRHVTMVARTIADLDGGVPVRSRQIGEAIQYQTLGLE